MQSDDEEAAVSPALSPPAAERTVAAAREVPQLTNRGTSVYRILRYGVDSLYLSFPGKLLEEAAAQLDTYKQFAQAGDEGQQALAQIVIGNHRFSVGGSGSRLFSYLLDHPDYGIQVAGKKARKVPLAYVQIKSRLITDIGDIGAASVLRELVSQLGVIEGPAKVSRIDLCADFTAPHGLDEWSKHAWVRRARHLDRHDDAELFSGWSIGRGGELMSRTYDKTLEIKKSKKDYMKGIWAKAGWDGISPVYRQEFQFRRGVLCELGELDLPSVSARLGDLWRYAGTDWLRLTVENGDSNKSRRPSHPLWKELMAIDWLNREQGTALIRTRRADTVPQDPRFYQGLMSLISRYMAAKAITDPDSAVTQLFNDAKQFYDDQGYVLGKSFDAQLTDKAACKAKGYNMLYPGYSERALDAGVRARADAYRKATGRE